MNYSEKFFFFFFCTGSGVFILRYENKCKTSLFFGNFDSTNLKIIKHDARFMTWYLVIQSVKNLPAVQETRVRSLGWEDPLEKEMATHSSILAWKISRTEEPGGL